MAAADVRRMSLHCSICLNTYTDPVTLRCGHDFCQLCINRVLDSQEGSGRFTCPEPNCTKAFTKRPETNRNISLRKLVEGFLAREKAEVLCTYCIDSPVPAVKSCVLCESSLCGEHLKVHSKSANHLLIEPSTSLEKRKCFFHKKPLEYFCTEEAVCICDACRLDANHRGHQVESLGEASEKKQQKIRNELLKIITDVQEIDQQVKSLQKHRIKAQEKDKDVRERIIALFSDIRKQLDDLENRVLDEVSRQETIKSLPISDVIQKMEKQKNELSRKMHRIEKLCDTTDPLTVLQDTEDLYGTGDKHDNIQVHEQLLLDLHDPNETLITEMLNTGLFDIAKCANVSFYMQEPTDFSLDVDTAGKHLNISDDSKKVSRLPTIQYEDERPERFEYNQVLSKYKLSRGKIYWDFECSERAGWIIGMSYPSIERKGEQSELANNNKSWGLQRFYYQYSAVHDGKKTLLPHNITSDRLRIFLDYEAGQLSFYELCDPIQHLHTFTATFTEPLHAALSVYLVYQGETYLDSSVRIVTCEKLWKRSTKKTADSQKGVYEDTGKLKHNFPSKETLGKTP
ncbi:E3 ubiquitin-protein ligase TRIM11-like [Hyperolius riggenbachi]|uniref:E3 ubiquitin-protein ligase TRIM11-like n=1 Tax=Hyperolius riggenbachi TaxID=752182 RepID=UPI0035A2AB14